MVGEAGGSIRCAVGVRRQEVVLTPLHETNRDRAHIKSIPIIAEWRQRIAAARANRIDPIQVTIARLTKEYADKCKPPLDQAGVVQVREVVSFVFQEIGGVAAVEQHSLLCTMRGDVMAALEHFQDD